MARPEHNVKRDIKGDVWDFCLQTKQSMRNPILTNLALTSRLDEPKSESSVDASTRPFPMASNLRTFPSKDPSPLLPTSGAIFSEDAEAVNDQGLVSGLLENLRDTFFTRKLPPLELASQPIAVIDPLAVKRDPLVSMLSFMLHGGAIAAIIWLMAMAPAHVVAPKVDVTPVYVMKPYIPMTVPAPKVMGGGGGGGARDIVAASKGRMPQVAKVPLAPPQMLLVGHPKLTMQAAVAAPKQVKMMTDNSLPNIGVTDSSQVALASQGAGSGAGFGHGRGGGIGSGHGQGIGMGNSAGFGGGVMSVGAGVSAPQLIHTVRPDFTEQAQQAKYEGTVEVQLIVDPRGMPVNLQIVKHLGMGLDEKALEAVRQYRFRPSQFQGHAVPVQIQVAVDFHLD